MKCVRVNDETWKELMKLKLQLDAKSVDEVIKKLISNFSS